MLFVDHGQREVAVFDGVLKQRMGADDDGDGAVLQAAQQFGTLAAFDRAGQERDGDGAEAGEGTVVLLRQHLGRRHDRGLGAGLDGAEHGQDRDQGLAGANVALQQAEHAAGGGEIGVDFGEGFHLGLGG